MNQRQRKLFLFMLNQPHYQPIQSICDLSGFSEKTIRNDIKTINAYLKEHHITSYIETKRGNGIRIKLEEDEKEFLHYFLESKVLEIKPDLDRFYHGMLLLLFSNELYTMDALVDALYTNRVQLKEELLCWESMLDTFDLSLSRNHHLQILGEEQQIRLFVLYYFYQMAGKAMPIIEQTILHENQAFFHKILHRYEQYLKQRFTSNAIRQFTIYLGIMVIRIQHQHPILALPHSSKTFQTTIQTTLQNEFHIEISDVEMQFLEDMIESGARQWNQDLLQQYPLLSSSKLLTTTFFQHLSMQYPMIYEEEMANLFAILLQTAMIRKKNHMSVLHIQDEIVKYESMPAFLSIMRIFHEDSALQQLDLYEGEFSRLTMLLLPIFDQLEQWHRYHVGLIVNCSLELAYYGKKRISQALPQIDIDYILTEDDIETIKDKVDFFISFDYLPYAIPFVEISSMIQDQDIRKLKSYLKELRFKAVKMLALPMIKKQMKASQEEDILYQLYEELCSQTDQISFETFNIMYKRQSLILQNSLVLILYDSRLSQNKVVCYELKKKCYLKGRTILSVVFITLSDMSYDDLWNHTLWIKHMLKTQFAYTSL